MKKGTLGQAGADHRDSGTDSDDPCLPAPASPSSRLCTGCAKDKKDFI
ncbi:MAG: hypothetical protein KH366_03865 [Clostridiaceae bacterium]|nr:hypothetical protein [Clostridiaceae bacterium]